MTFVCNRQRKTNDIKNYYRKINETWLHQRKKPADDIYTLSTKFPKAHPIARIRGMIRCMMVMFWVCITIILFRGIVLFLTKLTSLDNFSLCSVDIFTWSKSLPMLSVHIYLVYHFVVVVILNFFFAIALFLKVIKSCMWPFWIIVLLNYFAWFICKWYHHMCSDCI